MRLGLVGRGPQAQRYLLPRNSGESVVAQTPGRTDTASYRAWLGGIDGVLIATHPAGHRRLALEAIEAGKHVLIEKPLALTLRDCEDVLDAAEAAGVRLEVAHTHLWSANFPHTTSPPRKAILRLRYASHARDYSPWLDWGPHVMAMLEATRATQRVWTLKEGLQRELRLSVLTDDMSVRVYSGPEPCDDPPMARMLAAFRAGDCFGVDFQRRVYRALFQEQQDGADDQNRACPE